MGSKNTVYLNAQEDCKTYDKEKQTDRTTRMLIAVLILFLITEFPQAVLGIRYFFLF